MDPLNSKRSDRPALDSERLLVWPPVEDPQTPPDVYDRKKNMVVSLDEVEGEFKGGGAHQGFTGGGSRLLRAALSRSESAADGDSDATLLPAPDVLVGNNGR